MAAWMRASTVLLGEIFRGGAELSSRGDREDLMPEASRLHNAAGRKYTKSSSILRSCIQLYASFAILSMLSLSMSLLTYFGASQLLPQHPSAPSPAAIRQGLHVFAAPVDCHTSGCEWSEWSRWSLSAPLGRRSCVPVDPRLLPLVNLVRKEVFSVRIPVVFFWIRSSPTLGATIFK
jgi:hypothetical protein